MIKIANYRFKKKCRKGKYRLLVDEFLNSNEPEAAWKCADVKEVHSAVQGFQKEIRKQGSKPLIRVRASSVDLVVGLERVEY